MQRRASAAPVVVAILAIAALVYGQASGRPAEDFAPVSGSAAAARPAAGELPLGFVLPPSDAQLPVSSLVAADVDADGDLDIVAADASHGPMGIVVWVNDGTGQLTRKSPSHTTDLGKEPPAPSLSQHESTSVVSIQPHGPATQAAGINTWLTLPVSRCSASSNASVDSALVGACRSRSPPASLRS
jgi:hypothetical protein